MEISNLKKALFTLLYDQYNSPDIELRDSDDTYVDYIIGALIEKNKRICPYKNYDCVNLCECSDRECENIEGDNLNVQCFKDLEDIWREFIDIKRKGEM